MTTDVGDVDGTNAIGFGPPDPDDEFERQAAYERKVWAELDLLRVRDDAKRRLAAEQRPHVDPPEILTLRQRLARPHPPRQYRIDGWQPARSRVMLAAQFKAGKTTLTGNLARCLVDGDPWLGRHDVAPLDGAVTILDFEMSGDQIDDWLGAQQIRNDHQVVVVPMRGRAAAFDILDDKIRAHWVGRLHGVTGYLIVDCLRPILDALGLDEHRDAGRILVALDELLREADIDDCLVVHHMGHLAERSRGDSRIRDWPDVEWRLVRQDDDPASLRYISAYGRDVDILETQLTYNPTTRHLTLAADTRKDAAARAALDDILSALDDATEPLSGRKVELALASSDHAQKAIRAGLALGVRTGDIDAEPGPGRAILHTVSASVRHSALPVRQRTANECVSASIEDAHAPPLPDPPGASPLQLVDDLRSRPGRCPSCGWHIKIQGHAPACPQQEGSTT